MKNTIEGVLVKRMEEMNWFFGRSFARGSSCLFGIPSVGCGFGVLARFLFFCGFVLIWLFSSWG